ncbi:MAG: SDR family oxidoreductase [Chloroflexi bacterium]|nr:SDR family oxidoreductase [Chloroflexota bacterium]
MAADPLAPPSLGGCVALVTGASSGIGLATARLLADAGARVHGLARRRETMADGAGTERRDSGRVVPHALDVSDEPDVRRVVRSIGEEEGVDILVCAAGINVPGRRLEQLTPEVWDGMIATNLSGAFYVLHAALPYLRASRGIAVMISSVSAQWPDVSGPAYQASKAGMLALARAAGLEEHGRGVRFSTIMPGVVDTPLLDERPSPPDAETRARSLQPEDVARACLFVVTLPERAHVPELTILPTHLQALGRTS